MRAEDQYHVGIVVPDLDRAKAELSELFGYEWAGEMAFPTPVTFADGSEDTLDLRLVYSRTAPRLELVQSIGRAPWIPSDSGAHHLGYWSDDLDADGAALEAKGYAREVSGAGGVFAYHRSPAGARIELVHRSVKEAMEQSWA